jgi:hypothetical protein
MRSTEDLGRRLQIVLCDRRDGEGFKRGARLSYRSQATKREPFQSLISTAKNVASILCLAMQRKPLS